MTALAGTAPAGTAPGLGPLVEPGPEPGPQELARYARHLALPGIGVTGQRRLAAARVLVVGAGGLGSPALLYLAAAGVGTVGVVDDDVVETSNLQRQVVHGERDVGRAKTASAADAVRAVNAHVQVVEHTERLTRHNALDLLAGYDLVLDGSDAFATRYLVSDATEILGLPCVWGALHRFTGHVSTFWAAPRTPGVEGVTYRDVFPVPPPPGVSPDCATAGVLGAVCGTIGTIMATEAIKLITGAGRTLLGRLAVHDALEGTSRTLAVRPDPDRAPVTALLGSHASPGRDAAGHDTAGQDTPGRDAAGQDTAGADPYAVFCGVGGGPSRPAEVPAAELAAAAAPDAAGGQAGSLRVLDVRETWEARLDPFPGARVVPSGSFTGPDADRAVADVAGWAGGATVHVLCASGVRSARVAARLRAAGTDARSVAGGHRAWARLTRPAGTAAAPGGAPG